MYTVIKTPSQKSPKVKLVERSKYVHPKIKLGGGVMVGFEVRWRRDEL
jgi:hypothetical protein